MTDDIQRAKEAAQRAVEWFQTKEGAEAIIKMKEDMKQRRQYMWSIRSGCKCAACYYRFMQ